MTTAKRIPCRRKCRGGHPCVCTYIYRGQHHAWHICADPTCICHAEPPAVDIAQQPAAGAQEAQAQP